MSEDTQQSLTATNNGDLPRDLIERTTADLISAADALRHEEEQLRAQLDGIRAQRTRLDKAVTALTAAPTERKAVKAKGKRGATRGDAAVTRAADGYPGVSESYQQVVFEALKAIDKPVGPQELAASAGLARSSVGNALAHLRARGLVRWAGKSGAGGGHHYALWLEGDTEDTE
jgi:CRP-like cAMP-binding protein